MAPAFQSIEVFLLTIEPRNLRDIRDRALVCLAYDTMCRTHELVSLRSGGWIGEHSYKKVQDGHHGGGGDRVFVAVDHEAGVGVAERIWTQGGASVCQSVGECDREVAADDSPGGESESRLWLAVAGRGHDARTARPDEECSIDAAGCIDGVSKSRPMDRTGAERMGTPVRSFCACRCRSRSSGVEHGFVLGDAGG